MPRKQPPAEDAALAASARRLAEAVKRRRFELGIAQDDLAERGGPSVVTVRQLEQAKLRKPQGLTLAALDRALGWVSGSAARVWLDGEDPLTTTPGVVWVPQPEWEPAAVDRRIRGDSVGHVEQDAELEVMYRLPPGLSPRQRETARRLAQQSVQTYLDSLQEE